jgi:hypothetical protein
VTFEAFVLAAAVAFVAVACGSTTAPTGDAPGAPGGYGPTTSSGGAASGGAATGGAPAGGAPAGGAGGAGASDAGVVDGGADGGGDAGAGGALARVETFVNPKGKGKLRKAGDASAWRPRGADYVRLDGHHSTFDPAHYDAAAVEKALSRLEKDGYDAVRVFVDPGRKGDANGIGGPASTPGLEPTYVDAFVDFVERATAHHVYVMPILDRFPYNDHDLAIAKPADPSVAFPNTLYLHEPSLAAKRAYVTDFVSTMVARLGAHRTTILAYELENEAYFDGAKPPFSAGAITVKTSFGGPWSMSDPAGRQAAADAAASHYADTMAQAIHAVDAGALVTIGMFSYAATGHGGPNGLTVNDGDADTRFPVRPAKLSASKELAFLDFHTYPRGGGDSIAADLGSSEWGLVDARMPRVMAELGAFKQFYPDLGAAAVAMRDHQVASCAHDFGGWLFWTWDTFEQVDLWNLADGQGTINGVIAPKVRPNPCQP